MEGLKGLWLLIFLMGWGGRLLKIYKITNDKFSLCWFFEFSLAFIVIETSINMIVISNIYMDELPWSRHHHACMFCF